MKKLLVLLLPLIAGCDVEPKDSPSQRSINRDFETRITVLERSKTDEHLEALYNHLGLGWYVQEPPEINVVQKKIADEHKERTFSLITFP